MLCGTIRTILFFPCWLLHFSTATTVSVTVIFFDLLIFLASLLPPLNGCFLSIHSDPCSRLQYAHIVKSSGGSFVSSWSFVTIINIEWGDMHYWLHGLEKTWIMVMAANHVWNATKIINVSFHWHVLVQVLALPANLNIMQYSSEMAYSHSKLVLEKDVDLKEL